MLRAYCRSRRWAALLAAMAFAGIAALYGLYFAAAGPIVYTLLLLTVLLLAAAAVDFRAYRRRMAELDRLLARAGEGLGELPREEDPLLNRYLAVTAAVERARRRERAASAEAARRADTYYTLWMHQIKTPLAALGLLLREPEPDREALELELWRLEQYADMALQYQRLAAAGSDLAFAQQDAGALVRRAAKRVSTLFIARNVRLELGDVERTVLTDGKWLTFVLEQVLTNAAKYTHPGGRVRVDFAPEGCVLQVADDGIGIRPEDLPRIFQWGYTGAAGRGEGRSTGIGLALCRQAMDLLGHGISVDSRPGAGTTVSLDLSRAQLPLE